MQLPFTHDQFLDVFAAYNRSSGLAAVAIWLSSCAAAAALYRRGPGTSRFVAGMLAIQWAWAGAVYHWVYFRSINPAATLFGALFIVEAVLIFWRGVLTSSLTFHPERSVWRGIGTALVVYALLYPALTLAAGLTYPRAPSFGVPCPTVILTVGFLLLASKREARVAGVIPLLWSVVGGSAAVLLGVVADWALPIAGIALVAKSLPGRRSEPVGVPSP